MSWTRYGKEVMLGAARREIRFASLHYGVPYVGNELPVDVYSRRPVHISRPDGEVMLADKILFDIPAGSRVTHAGYTTAESGGEMVCYAKLPKEFEFKGRGVLSLDLTTMDLALESVD